MQEKSKIQISSNRSFGIVFFIVFLAITLWFYNSKGIILLYTAVPALIFLVLGLCGSSGNLLLTQSYRLAEASLVTPIKYLSLVFAIIFGFIIWSEVPKILTLLGAGLVILSSLIIFIRETKLKKQIINPRI